MSLFKLGDIPYVGTCHPKPVVSFLVECLFCHLALTSTFSRLTGRHPCLVPDLRGVLCGAALLTQIIPITPN